MPPHKTTALVLTVLPYRESSCILHLYSDAFGLIQGIAKGIRRQGKERTIIERGFLIETVAYVHPHRSLHTLGTTAVVDFFSNTRESLLKTAIRDAACELCSGALHSDEPNPELFDFLLTFFRQLDNQPAEKCFPFLLWDFFNGFSRHLGFGLNLDTCVSCGSPLAASEGGILLTDQGGFICSRCRPAWEGTAFLPLSVIKYLAQTHHTDINPGAVFQKDIWKKTTQVLALYCRYHFESRHEYRSLQFVEEMIDGMAYGNLNKK